MTTITEAEAYGRELTDDERERRDRMFEQLNRLAKWRSVFAGWQLGTRPDSDPECRAVRDHVEARLILRAELTAVVGLLIRKGVVEPNEYFDAIGTEADLMCEDLEVRFPGFTATDYGMSIDPTRAAETMRGWKK